MKDQVLEVTLLQYGFILMFVLAGVALAVEDFRVREQVTEEAVISEQADTALNLPITPLPLNVKLDERKVLLGERLYNDPRFSHDNTISCASCHDLKKGGIEKTDQALYRAKDKGRNRIESCKKAIAICLVTWRKNADFYLG